MCRGASFFGMPRRCMQPIAPVSGDGDFKHTSVAVAWDGEGSLPATAANLPISKVVFAVRTTTWRKVSKVLCSNEGAQKTTSERFSNTHVVQRPAQTTVLREVLNRSIGKELVGLVDSLG